VNRRIATNFSERVAQFVFETVLVGVRAHEVTDQSHGELDFKLVSEQFIGETEVTTATIQSHIETLQMLSKFASGLDAVECKRSWLVVLNGKLRQHQLEKIDRYLSAIEAVGVSEFGNDDTDPFTPIGKIYHELNLLEGEVIDVPPPAKIWVVGPSQSNVGSMVDGHDLRVAVEIEANKEDNKRKLARRPEQKEIHFFVYVEPLSIGAWQALICHRLPTQLPRLPAGVTHLWAVALDDCASEFIVWMTEVSSGTQSFYHVPKPDGLASRGRP
jgi:hypothetical protein